MIYEVDKYNAEILKIAGFALMTPFGRIIVQPTIVFGEFNLIWFFIYVGFCLLLFFLGVVFVVRGYDILDLQRRN